ncbi:hypothetical protein RB213_011544 [Colletotrichum asianum]|uniref:Uncharacterized protein n=1 Tax=Colletotrichum asianum TaxID=702518 RepID=A0A8H3W867_9PEZI|nr:hypothetical protein GQ607_012896 [Colletotrichum asianum]
MAFADGTASEFTVPSVNLEVQCSSLELTDTITFTKSLKEPLAGDFNEGGTLPNGTTSIPFRQTYPSSGYVSSFLYMTRASKRRFIDDLNQPLTISYGSKTFEDQPPIQVHDGSKWWCLHIAGHVYHARKVPIMLQRSDAILAIFMRGHFCGMGSSNHMNEASQTDDFLIDGFVSDQSNFYRKIYEVPLAVFEERFQ